MSSLAFVQGVLKGASSPIWAIYPKRVMTRIDERVFRPSYRPLEEDRKNIQKDFDKALAYEAKAVAIAKK